MIKFSLCQQGMTASQKKVHLGIEKERANTNEQVKSSKALIIIILVIIKDS